MLDAAVARCSCSTASLDDLLASDGHRIQSCICLNIYYAIICALPGCVYAVVQAVGASGAAALRPSLQTAANKGVDSVRRAVLMSAEQSKQTLCVALLREVGGYVLLVQQQGPRFAVVLVGSHTCMWSSQPSAAGDHRLNQSERYHLLSTISNMTTLRIG